MISYLILIFLLLVLARCDLQMKQAKKLHYVVMVAKYLLFSIK